MIWPVLSFISLAINIAALVRVGAREPRSIISFGVGADVDTFTEEQLAFINGPRRTDEPARDFFDSAMWMDADTEDPEEIASLDEEIADDDDRFGNDLWQRPELVGGP